MIFTQYYLDCLSHASYLIGDETSGRAVVVDPQRDIAEYLDDAKSAGLTIELVLETHFHADFLSGHLELAAATGAEIGFSSVADPEYRTRKLEDNTVISLGQVSLEIRHTPGHTPESISIVVWENSADETPYGVLTGDTLFIGDVGRPDLLAATGTTPEAMAADLYESLHTQLMVLPDETRVFPAHGAGSACGKNLSTETSSTIGEQRQTNYAIRAPDRDSFIELVTEGQQPAPSYFAFNAKLNQQDRGLLNESEVPRAMSFEEVQAELEGGAVIVDGRDSEEFTHGHIVNSINVGLLGRYAEYVGSVISPETDIILVMNPGAELEGKNRLGRIGFDRVVGYLEHPLETMAAHPTSVAAASRLTSTAFAEIGAETPELQIVDVRNPGEVEAGAISHAQLIPLGQLIGRLEELDPKAPTVVYCAGGYRSSIAASLLRQRGFSDVSDIIGGYAAVV
jgi:hydroxyacylglutathione hydrolase